MSFSMDYEYLFKIYSKLLKNIPYFFVLVFLQHHLQLLKLFILAQASSFIFVLLYDFCQH